MGEIAYLIDTNAVIDYLGRKMPDSGMDFMNNVINSIPNVSVITKIEVLGFNASTEHAEFLTGFMDDASVFDLSPEIVDLTISIRKSFKAKLPDSIIAATAIANGMTLITRNTADFKNIVGLEVLNPHSL